MCKGECLVNFHRPDAPTVVGLILHAGIKCNAVFHRGSQHGTIHLADFGYAGNCVGAGPQLGGQGNFVAQAQGVNFPEVAVCASVMTGNTAVAIPNAGTFKMSRSLCKNRSPRPLIDLDIYIKAGDF